LRAACYRRALSMTVFRITRLFTKKTGQKMKFTLSEEQLALQDSARRFARRELSGLAQEAEANDEPPGIALRRRFAELGFLGINLDAAWGGAGMSHLEAVLVLEEIASVSPALAFPIF